MGDTWRENFVDTQASHSLAHVLALIEERSIPEPNSGCLLWEGGLRVTTGPINRQYGNISMGGRMHLVHRLRYEIEHGPLTPDQQVLHTCDVPLCVNLDHLFIGTNDYNHADKARKDRGRKRLTHAQALEIHRLHRQGGFSMERLAVMFDVNPSTVSRVLSGVRRPLALLIVNRE